MSATIYQLPTQLSGTVDVFPNFKYMVTGDDLATITTAGYLNQIDLQSNPIAPTDILQILYSFNQQTNVGTFSEFSVAISNGVITLVPVSQAGEGDVLLNPAPAKATNNIVVFDAAANTIKQGTGGDTAIFPGSLQAGLSGQAGLVASFPPSANSGSLRLQATNNAGGFISTISNTSVGRPTVYSLQDPGVPTANFALTAAALVNGNLVSANGTVGLLQDAGISVTNVQNKTNIIANNTGQIGGGGAGPITIPASGLINGSTVVATVQSSSNPVSVIACLAHANSFDITFSGDPGASCIVSYVAFKTIQP